MASGQGLKTLSMIESRGELKHSIKHMGQSQSKSRSQSTLDHGRMNRTSSEQQLDHDMSRLDAIRKEFFDPSTDDIIQTLMNNQYRQMVKTTLNEFEINHEKYQIKRNSSKEELIKNKIVTKEVNID